MSISTIAIIEPGYKDYDIEKMVLEVHNPVLAPVRVDEDAASSLARLNPVAVLIRERTMSDSEMASCPNLKIISRYGVGVDNIDLEAASKRKIFVSNVPDYGAEIEVSEHAIALYLAIQRRIIGRDREVREGRWNIGQNAPIPNRENATLGLVGCGKIGIATAQKFRALGFGKVLGFDPYLDEKSAQKHGIFKSELDFLCENSDVISLHAPYSPETHHILGREMLMKMKSSAVLVNVSRGGLVDEIALAELLCDGRIFGAGLDVFEQEPIDSDNPLLEAPNTVLTDHTAWYSERSVKILQRKAAEEVDRVLKGQVPRNWVNCWH